MGNLKKILIIFILLVIYIYVCNIILLPNNVILFQGEELNLGLILGLSIKPNEETRTIQTATNLGTRLNTTQKVGYSLNLFGQSVKDVNVNIIPKTKVVPVGMSAGLKLYTSGVLVVGMSEIKKEDNEKCKPYENCGIKEGDTIVSINDKNISSTDELIQIVNNANGNEVNIEYISENTQKVTSIKPAKTSEGEYKLGLWVRDAAAGVGTITFYEPSTKKFAALGHGITDIDTDKIVTIAAGELVTTDIISIVKGEKGSPGEMKGSIDNSKTIGYVAKNTPLGIYGNVTNLRYLNINNDDAIDVALRSEIKKGKAQIICELENGKREIYDIEIEQIYSGNNEDNKSMMIRVTDERLIEKTGGIIQGMSGSPIIQDGKFIGAVTHVLVNDSCKGYAVFADMMIKQLREVNS